MISFSGFVRKISPKKATSNTETQQIRLCLSLSAVGIYLQDGLFNNGNGNVKVHSTKEKHWVAYIRNFF